MTKPSIEQLLAATVNAHFSLTRQNHDKQALSQTMRWRRTQTWNWDYVRQQIDTALWQAKSMKMAWLNPLAVETRLIQGSAVHGRHGLSRGWPEPAWRTNAKTWAFGRFGRWSWKGRKRGRRWFSSVATR